MKVCVAMRRVDNGSSVSGVGSQFDMAGTEGQRLSTAAGKHDGAGAEPSHLDACHGPGVGPRPWLGLMTGCDGLGERPLQQDLRQLRLGVDIGALGEEDETGECKKDS